MRFFQLSDLHLTADGLPLFGKVDTEGAFHRALGRLRELVAAADVLLITGDLANDGDVSAYRRLETALAGLSLPYAIMPGNHDERAALRAAFPEQAWEGDPLCCQRLEWDGATLLLLDTTVPGKEWGETGAAQLGWLEEACPRDRSVLLCLHHPPFDVGIPGMDAIRCRDAERLADWLQRTPNVEALLCGHVHRVVTTSFVGRPALTAPSTAHQITFGLEEGPLAYTLEIGGFLWHDWQPGKGLLTHYLPVEKAPTYLYGD